MLKKFNITMNGKRLVVDIDTKICDLLEKAPHRGKRTAVGAKLNNRVVGLRYSLKCSAEIVTIDISDREGMDIYRRTASTVLYAAVAKVAPDARIVVGQSIGSGYFFEIHNHVVDEKFIQDVDRTMKNIVAADIPISRKWIPIEEAIEIFSSHNASDRVKLVSQLKRSEIPMISVGDYRGYAHGPIAYKSSLIDSWNLVPYEHGMVLIFPDSEGNLETNFSAQPKLFATYLEAKRWNELMHIENVADLNERCMGRKSDEMVKVAEAIHEKKISAIADTISSNENLRLILISGPTSSGKTTFSKRLRIHLKIFGLEPVTISLDNYYLDRDDSPRHPDGTYDFETINALDLELFNDHLTKLLKGKEIEMPAYSFSIGKRDPSKLTRMKLGRGQIIIVEGIHGLNEELTKSVPHQNKFKIYVSALTQLCLDDHNRIFTTDTRLCRRIIRDRLFRGTTAADTIEGWQSVRHGEKKYIFPYQENADVMFNSALPYEHSLLKPYAEKFLAEVPREHPSYMEAYRLTKFFSFFIPILSREVPHTSILREFIGDSAFRY